MIRAPPRFPLPFAGPSQLPRSAGARDHISSVRMINQIHGHGVDAVHADQLRGLGLELRQRRTVISRALSTIHDYTALRYRRRPGGCTTGKWRSRDSSAKRLESERMPYARQGALLWGSLVSCGRLAIGQLAFARDSGGCQPPRRLPACPTSRQRLHFHVAHPALAPWGGARLESGGRRDSSAKLLESERMPYARQGALLWGSLVSCGRLAIGQLPRLHGIAAVANRRAGCQPAPRHGSGSTFMSRTHLRPLCYFFFGATVGAGGGGLGAAGAAGGPFAGGGAVPGLAWS